MTHLILLFFQVISSVILYHMMIVAWVIGERKVPGSFWDLYILVVVVALLALLWYAGLRPHLKLREKLT